MKKILYFLLLSTMVVYFTGCKDKKDEEVTLEISEANLIGKWNFDKYEEGEYIDGKLDYNESGKGEGEYYIINADHTYIDYDGEYTEKGTWKLNGKLLIFNSVENEEEYTILKLTTSELVLYGEDREDSENYEYWTEYYKREK